VAHRCQHRDPDHNVPTTPERKGGIEAIADQVSRLQVQTLDDNCDEYGIVEFKMNDVARASFTSSARSRAPPCRA
jgi:homoaconitase/3-isopropylmalate dehydratase large subunit